MNVISGCPRSGTSLMMELMRTGYGDSRIIGTKFPREERLTKLLKKGESESQEKYNTRMYLFNRFQREKMEKESQRSTGMNPNGFWEMEYTTNGIYYRFEDIERLCKIKEEGKGSFCKIVSQGLYNSDPLYIDKVIYMIRDPRSVAKSQENLNRLFPMDRESGMRMNGREVKIHTPEMYIQVTILMAEWFLKYPDIPVLFIHYDDLLDNPLKCLMDIEDFLGEKFNDFDSVLKRIDKKLKRSLPEDIENDLWEDAEFVYQNFCEKKYQEIIDYFQTLSSHSNQSNLNFKCLRSGELVNLNVCKTCRLKSSNYYIKNKIIEAEQEKIKWNLEPCMYECFYIEDVEGITPMDINESIKNNFWVDSQNNNFWID